MNLYIIAFGPLKTVGLRETMSHYLERLNFFHRTTELELKASPSAADNRQRFHKALEKISRPAPIFLLDERGSNLTTQKWSALLDKQQIQGAKSAVFAIGPAYGFDQEFIASLSATLISLGAHTLPHELARVVLTEQLYRASSLLAKHPYHHEG